MSKANEQGTGNKASPAAATPFPKGVSQPAIRALASAGYTRLDQLEHATERKLATLLGMGPKALRILAQALKDRGKVFRS
jgi:hypothetical protein